MEWVCIGKILEFGFLFGSGGVDLDGGGEDKIFVVELRERERERAMTVEK